MIKYEDYFRISGLLREIDDQLRFTGGYRGDLAALEAGLKNLRDMKQTSVEPFYPSFEQGKPLSIVDAIAQVESKEFHLATEEECKFFREKDGLSRLKKAHGVLIITKQNNAFGVLKLNRDGRLENVDVQLGVIPEPWSWPIAAIRNK